MKSNYKNIWLAFVNIKAEVGFKFNDLIDSEFENNIQYKGAWANILVKANNISEVVDLIPLGLAELNFKVEFIDKIENVASLIESKEINENVIEEVIWLNKSSYVFKISDKLFPYK